MRPYYFPAHLYLKKRREKEHNPGPYAGEAFTVPRDKLPGVRTRLYRPAAEKTEDLPETLPVLFNIHGGGWIFGDAEGVDLQSQYLANHMGCFVVNIDYRLLDEEPFPYPQTEAADAAEYFLDHAAEYRIDPEKAAVMGYSAGGHIAAGAAMLLRDRGVKLRSQILCYPFLDFIGFDFAAYGGFGGTKGKLFNRFTKKVFFEKMPMESPLLSPGNAASEALRDLAPAVIVGCGAGDTLLPQAARYAEKLKAAGVPTVYRVYEKGIHGFIEHNFKDDPAVFEKEDEQDTLMRDAVEFIKAQDPFGSDRK